MPRKSKHPSGALRIIMAAPDGSIAVDAPALVTRRWVTDVLDDDGDVIDQEVHSEQVELSEIPAAFTKHKARLESMGFEILNDGATGADLPNERAGQSRRFRNSWRWDGTKIEPDLPMCRAQVLAEVRSERDARLAATDGAAVREIERGRPDAALTTYRQALRDLPDVVEGDLAAIHDPAEMEAYAPNWPTAP